MNILKSKKSIGILIVSMIATNTLTYFYSTKKSVSVADEADQSVHTDNSSGCTYKVQRLNGYDFIKPILFVDTQCESEKLSPVKQSVTTLINNYKNIGVINSASVYLKEYQANDWTGINMDEKFLPGSLMKVPELIAYLKMNELKPGTLDKVLLFDKTTFTDRHVNFGSKSIQLGKKYTIRELLKYMITYSDNNATDLLNRNIDLNVFKKVFTDLGMDAPDWSAKNYPITAKQFSVFMRTLYNGTYLNDENSEIATQLLSKCDFKEGLVAGLPTNTKVAHKFGEAGTTQEQQLSESAIIYLDNNPYVITIMTRGKDYKQLPLVIKEISNVVYQFMQQNDIASN
ncbi:serine hydrolase [Flavobacterium sp.]|uniref:serine hydrolase n=1 Tax=Flavobacterium sp. TaxID=239 RepID=UPI00286D4894|nr:serine hydrolase [Flavobacterium sp.]